MKFSIALTTFNSGAYLSTQLRSLAEQTRLPDELVVCDDGSTDGTIGALAEFAATAKFPVRIFRNEKNLGYAQNFAKAVSLCEGDWIFLCDHDDDWLPQKLARFEASIQARPELAGLFSDSELVDGELRSLGTSLFVTNRFHGYEQDYIRRGEAWRAFLRHNVVAGHALAFRADLRRFLLPIPPGWVHDAWIATVLSRLGPMEFLTDRLVRYRQHPKQYIGVVSGGPIAKLRARWRRMGSRAELQTEADRWRALAAVPAWKEEPARDALAEKIRWLQGRASLPRVCLLRIPFVLVRAPLYFRFDNGWQTMLKDLLIS